MSSRQNGKATAPRRYEMRAGVVATLRLRTATKALCNCAVAPTDDEPNAHVCPVCLGLPGALPVLNARAVEAGVRAAIAFCCTVTPVSVFARAHRVAPAFPKGYRVTQNDRVLATRGHVTIGETPEGAALRVAVRRVMLDEEGGRIAHGRVRGAAALDYNLAGAPLLRVESAPEMRSAAEVVAFVRALRRLARGAGASDARLEDGSLVVRTTVSTRVLGDLDDGAECAVVGPRSLGSLRAAVGAEFARQAALRDAGNAVEAGTMLWTDEGALVAARAPDGEAHPHWLPEPDLPPLVLTAEWIDARRAEVPAQPTARRAHLAREYALGGAALDALSADPELADYYEVVARRHGDPRAAADWVLGPVLDAVLEDEGDLDAFSLRVRPADLADLLDMQRDAKLGPTAARHVFGVMRRTGDPPARVARRERLWPVPDA